MFGWRAVARHQKVRSTREKLKLTFNCRLVAGEFDDVLKSVRRHGDFNRSDQLIALPGVRQARTFLVTTEVVNNAALESRSPTLRHYIRFLNKY